MFCEVPEIEVEKSYFDAVFVEHSDFVADVSFPFMDGLALNIS